MGFTKDYLIDQENEENFLELISSDDENQEQYEIWKTIQDYPNYQISSLGRVKNIKTQRIIKQTINSQGYYCFNIRNNDNIKYVKIHKLIAKYFIPNPENLQFLDHINNNRLDNRIQNLRYCSKQQNNMNKSKQKKQSSSIYKGVDFIKKSQKFRARIVKDYKEINLGLFDNEVDAGKAYDKKAKELFGEFAKLNFPN